ncbi:ABC transporter substrate-binding protein, partial [Campylobacter jejuni]|nr:ABC transporter substrate-binding protein [Campylobacter jejuni]
MSKKFFLSLGLVALLFSNSQAIDENLIKAAQAEGRVNSLAMPDTWANW